MTGQGLYTWLYKMDRRAEAQKAETKQCHGDRVEKIHRNKISEAI